VVLYDCVHGIDIFLFIVLYFLLIFPVDDVDLLHWTCITTQSKWRMSQEYPITKIMSGEHSPYTAEVGLYDCTQAVLQSLTGLVRQIHYNRCSFVHVCTWRFKTYRREALTSSWAGHPTRKCLFLLSIVPAEICEILLLTFCTYSSVFPHSVF